MKPFAKVTEQDIARFGELLSPDRVFSGEAIKDDYAHDEMGEYGAFMPECLLMPLTIEEISAVMKHCYARSLPVTPRGAGTGLCGGAVCIHGGVLLSVEKMTKLIEIDRANMTATLQPGLLLMEFYKKVEDAGLFYAPDPGEKSATVGGNVMTNAGGMRAVRYGVTRDYVIGMKVVLSNGDILDLGGKVTKTSSGLPLLQLMIGSEGTLGILGEVTVKLLPAPKENLSVLAPFDDLQACIDAVPEVLALGLSPTAVEFMEREVIVSAEDYLGKQFPDHAGSAYMLIRVDGASAQAMEADLDKLADLLLALGAKDVLLADTEERKTAIWDARGAFLEAIKSGTPSMDECDVVVPRSMIGAFVKKAVAIGEQFAIRIRSFGHAGDGNLHIYICRDTLDDAAWHAKLAPVMQALYDYARELGGLVSGEHGVGHAKAAFLRESVGDRAYSLMQSIKAAFDPTGIMNPGKVCP